MYKKNLKRHLKFYFITDHQNTNISMLEQVKEAVLGGATIVQYRNKNFLPGHIDEVYEIKKFLKLNKIPFIINDNILLAKAVDADGIHLGQDDFSPASARNIIGKNKIIGISVSDLYEFENTDFSQCDYIGLGPVFPTNTKKDAKKACGLDFVSKITSKTTLPVVGIGGINIKNCSSVIEAGALGICVISALTGQNNIFKASKELSSALKISLPQIREKWKNEFELINKLCRFDSFNKNLKISAGDDAALLFAMKNPVISTDTQREDIHFRLSWQSFHEIGFKAVSVCLSDLAASYAKPVSVFINLGLPEYVSDEDVLEIYRGIDENLSIYNCSIGGGNISSSEKLSIDLFAVGEGSEIFPKRSEAKEGDLICSTGFLGLSRAGLEILDNNIEGYDFLINAFKRPAPKFFQSEILKESGINCVTDISDGLYGDLSHIAKASEITVVIDNSNILIHPELQRYCKNHNKNPIEYIISGGEDYELLFTCSISEFEEIKNKIPDAFIAGKAVRQRKDLIISEITGESFDHGK
ncbi:MAG: thiamine-phosphate kinase [Desulfobacteraceae bacterium]|nr:thiamine-phosphate kinase [Desulfobacteraceae bacterium]MCB9494728.1 thiamine-phosphate kinase [Desulfobacteraceae bacterium]